MRLSLQEIVWYATRMLSRDRQDASARDWCPFVIERPCEYKLDIDICLTIQILCEAVN